MATVTLASRPFLDALRPSGLSPYELRAIAEHTTWPAAYQAIDRVSSLLTVWAWAGPDRAKEILVAHDLAKLAIEGMSAQGLACLATVPQGTATLRFDKGKRLMATNRSPASGIVKNSADECAAYAALFASGLWATDLPMVAYLVSIAIGDDGGIEGGPKRRQFEASACAVVRQHFPGVPVLPA